MGKPLLIVLALVIAFMIVSWTLGELLRQRKPQRTQRKERAQRK